MLTSFNWADWAIVAVISASALISLIRGFVREALSLASWAAAFFIAVAFHQPMVELMASWVEKPYLREILAYVLLFAGTLVLGSLVTYLVAEMVKRTGLSGTDRLLGMMFGTARGLIVILALVVLLPSLLNGVDQDLWWKESRLIPEFSMMGEWSEQTFNDLVNWVSSFFASHSS
ncbi:CvpA family protein [Spongiibacter taiwanensis]|uniref:CvpA family protein n=1 Tax=Spongiibacter taiwanensis TaxID=1748242 RepID=UPI00203634CD|nr:CvpA family protein [Spongiibacter taiwanensis]USA43200.1 CvpA family protein [Spongiibacter taiwanensis]